MTVHPAAIPEVGSVDRERFEQEIIPAGRPVGSTSAIDIDPDGKSVWIVERCGTLNNCIGSQVNPVMEFDSTGKVQRQFGKGLFVYPHGMFVDREGNVWATDLQTNFNRPFVMGTQNHMPDAPKGTKPAGAVGNAE